MRGLVAVILLTLPLGGCIGGDEDDTGVAPAPPPAATPPPADDDVPAPPNLAPTATLEVGVGDDSDGAFLEVEANGTVTIGLDAAASRDPEGGPLGFAWVLEASTVDGLQSPDAPSGATGQFTVSAPAVVRIGVTVTDDRGQRHSADAIVLVHTAFEAAGAVPAVDGPLPDTFSAVSTNVTASVPVAEPLSVLELDATGPQGFELRLESPAGELVANTTASGNATSLRVSQPLAHGTYTARLVFPVCTVTVPELGVCDPGYVPGNWTLRGRVQVSTTS